MFGGFGVGIAVCDLSFLCFLGFITSLVALSVLFCGCLLIVTCFNVWVGCYFVDCWLLALCVVCC